MAFFLSSKHPPELEFLALNGGRKTSRGMVVAWKTCGGVRFDIYFMLAASCISFRSDAILMITIR